MTTSACPALAASSLPYQRLKWVIRFWRGLLFCALFSIILLPEFVRGDSGNSSALFFAKVLGGFRVIDVAVLLLISCHLASLVFLREKVLHFPRNLSLPGMAFLCCIAIAAIYGNSRGGTNFFFDWRGLALGIGLYIVWSLGMRSVADVDSAIRLFAVYMAARIVLIYALYIFESHDTLLGVSIPLFDGPSLSCITFTALLALRYQGSAARPAERLYWGCLAAASSLLVLLCFRRTYWGELALGALLLTLFRKRSRFRNLVLIGSVTLTAALLLGSSFSSRLKSFAVTSEDSEFSADNADHLLDLADAWEQVRQSPVMGIGLGVSYPTWHIRRWKSESVMVHNAPLHVWLKYGLAGLLCYLWFHLGLLQWLYRPAHPDGARPHPFLLVAFVYLTAQFAMTLGFAPWPYSELQLTTLMSFILAASAAVIAWSPAPWRLTS